MTRRPPRSTRTCTPFPYTTLFRSADDGVVTANAGELAEARGVGERLRMQARDCRGAIAAAHRFDETQHELLVLFGHWRCSCAGCRRPEPTQPARHPCKPTDAHRDDRRAVDPHFQLGLPLPATHLRQPRPPATPAVLPHPTLP